MHPLGEALANQQLRKSTEATVFGGLVGAVQMFAGLSFVHKVGTGNFMALTVSAALIASLVIDHFGWFRMEVQPVNLWI
jgi:bacterial/archaeal transporter family-2 protein